VLEIAPGGVESDQRKTAAGPTGPSRVHVYRRDVDARRGETACEQIQVMLW